MYPDGKNQGVVALGCMGLKGELHQRILPVTEGPLHVRSRLAAVLAARGVQVEWNKAASGKVPLAGELEHDGCAGPAMWEMGFGWSTERIR